MMKIIVFFCLTILLFGLGLHPTFAQAPAVYSPRVLVIGIDPTDNSGASLANTYFKSQMSGQDSNTFEVEHAGQTINDFKDLSEGRIQYVLAGHLHITSFPTYPNGYQFTVSNYSQCVWGRPEYNPTQCEAQKWLFPYVQYIQDQHICEQAAAVNADEIWIYSPPYILAYEAFMIGPTPGFDVNGPSFTVASCAKHYIVVNAAYDIPNNMLHSYGHRIESTVSYLMRDFTSTDRMTYWERFAGLSSTTRSSGTPFCGNVHFPFNFRNEYDYSNSQPNISACADFANFPDYTGVQTMYGCSVWGCSDRGWQEHWFSFIPHSIGTTMIRDITGRSYAFKKDWWYYILYPENALRSETGVFPSTCAEDINSDGFVDLSDYSLLVNNFFKLPILFTASDINEDGIVDLSDYSLLVNKFLTVCP